MELPVEYPVFICAAASLLITLYWSLSAIKPRSMFFIALGAVALAVASFFGYYRLFLFDFRPNGVPVG